MEFGIPKEVRDLEARVGLTPNGVASLTRLGHTVYVEKNAGATAGFDDESYRRNGAQVVYSPAEVYGRSDVVVKVTRPTADEHKLFRTGQTLISFLHLSVASPDLLAAMREAELTAIACEMITRRNGVRPVLIPMSEVAGRLAPIIAGQLLMTNMGGRGTLLSGIPGVPRGSVVILGAGVLGRHAARAFLGIGAQVIVLDNDIGQLGRLDEALSGRITTMLCTKYNLNRVTQFADVVVGAVLTAGQRAPILITREMVRQMRPGTVIIDYAIDQGGCLETSRPTTMRDQTYVVDDVIHHCVPNITSAVARTTSYGLTNALIPYLQGIGEHGLVGLLEEQPSIASGINLWQGKLAHPVVAAELGVPVELNLPHSATSKGE